MRIEKFRCDKRKNKIVGNLYLPDSDGPFPLLIYSHGYGYSMEVISMKRMAENGIAACSFDFCGGSQFSKSSGSSVSMSVLTEAEDLETVLDKLKLDNRFNKNRIFLSGNSQGGYVSTVTGIRRKDEIKGMFLMSPAFVITDFRKQFLGGGDAKAKMRFGNMIISKKYVDDIDCFPIYKRMSDYSQPVVIYHGTVDEMAPIRYSEKAIECFPNAELVKFTGGDHMLYGFSGLIEKDIIARILK